MKLEKALTLVQGGSLMSEKSIVEFFQKKIDSVEFDNGVKLDRKGQNPISQGKSKGCFVQYQNSAYHLDKRVHYEVTKMNAIKQDQRKRGLYIRLDDERGSEDEMRNDLKKVTPENIYNRTTKKSYHLFAYPDPMNCNQKPEVVITEVWKGLKALYDMFDSTLERFGTRSVGAETNHPSTDSAMNDNPNRPSSSSFDPRNLIYFGAPGTGKSHELNKKVVEDFGDRYERVTFYPTYSYAQFVGCYKPVMKPKVGEETGEEEIAYEFVPGPFLRILVEALNDPENRYCLVIEEINRANAAAVFGDVFQLLDRDEKGQSEYDVAATEDMRRHLDKALSDIGKETLKNLAGEGNLKIPDNMYIWATMNSADQGVFPMDTAFKRRWAFKYVGINDGVTDDCKKWTVGGSGFLWNEVRTFLNERLTDNGVNEDKLMGPWFVKPENGSVVSLDQFRSKVLMYLWEDAARMCRRKFFADKVKTYPDLVKCWPDAFKGIENWEDVKAGWIPPGRNAAMDGAGAPEETAEPQTEAMPAATATGTETQPSE